MSRDVAPRRRGVPTPGVPLPANPRFRRADAPPVRRRRHSRIWVALRWLVVIGCLTFAVLAARRYALESERFRVRDITVRGNVHLETSEVEFLLQGIRSQNLFLVDFEQYRRRVMDSSWVEHVALSRVLPATLVVDVIERTPIAAARLNQDLYMVDRTGNIIDDYRAEHSSYDLAIVDGLFGSGPETATHVDPERMQVTAILLDELASRPDLGRRVSQIDVTNPRDVVVMIDDDVAWLHLGTADFADRLQRYLDVRPALLDRFGAIEYADLKFDERIYVRGRNQRTGEAAAR